MIHITFREFNQEIPADPKCRIPITALVLTLQNKTPRNQGKLIVLIILRTGDADVVLMEAHFHH